MIEGVGDEVTVLFGIFSLLSLMTLAWISTHVNDPILVVVEELGEEVVELVNLEESSINIEININNNYNVTIILVSIRIGINIIT